MHKIKKQMLTTKVNIDLTLVHSLNELYLLINIIMTFLLL